MNAVALQINDIIRKHPAWDYAKHEIDQKPSRTAALGSCIFVTVKGWDRNQHDYAARLLRAKGFSVMFNPSSPMNRRKEIPRLVIAPVPPRNV